MSMKEQYTPEFAQAFRGYDREQVDGYVAWLRDVAIQAEDRVGRAESALAQCRRELASSPTTAGISERLAAMLQLATEEAADIRQRAQRDSDAPHDATADPRESELNNSDRAGGRGSDANGVPSFDEAEGAQRKRQYEDGADLVSGID